MHRQVDGRSIQVSRSLARWIFGLLVVVRQHRWYFQLCLQDWRKRLFSRRLAPGGYAVHCVPESFHIMQDFATGQKIRVSVKRKSYSAYLP